jgi:serine protease
MSLAGGCSCTNSVENSINYAVSRGISVIVAAGNSNSDASGFWPCNCSGVVCVAAVDRYDYKASYSNYGSNVFISDLEEVQADGYGQR